MISRDSIRSSFWRVFPLAMFILCIFMIWGKKGPIICGFGSANTESYGINDSDSAMDILDKRNALGEISKEEYERKKGTLYKRNKSG